MTRRAQIADLLRTRLFTGLHLGLLRHQGRLPSIRELAREFDANPRVVLAAYRTLAQEGLVELRSRSGVFMAPAGRRNHATADGRSDWMVDVLVQGLTRGMSAPILAEGLQRCLETLRLHAVVVECNEDQLYSVPAELKRDFGLETTVIDVAALDQGGRPPALLRRADLLVTTPFHKAAVERLADSLGTPKIVITMCTDLFTEVGRLLSTMPVYFVVVDPRFAAKLHRLFEGVPGAANLRPLVVGRDDLRHIPETAPTYLTQLARVRVGETPLLQRVLPEARIFSAESARQLLTFIVRANRGALTVRTRAEGYRTSSVTALPAP